MIGKGATRMPLYTSTVLLYGKVYVALASLYIFYLQDWGRVLREVCDGGSLRVGRVGDWVPIFSEFCRACSFRARTLGERLYRNEYQQGLAVAKMYMASFSMLLCCIVMFVLSFILPEEPCFDAVGAQEGGGTWMTNDQFTIMYMTILVGQLMSMFENYLEGSAAFSKHFTGGGGADVLHRD